MLHQSKPLSPAPCARDGIKRMAADGIRLRMPPAQETFGVVRKPIHLLRESIG
jgi:hypothetical protein